MFFAVLALLSGASFVCSEKTSGTVNLGDDDGFSFLGKFCFDYKDTLEETAGFVSVDIANGASNDRNEYKFLMYDDQPDSWAEIYDTGMTCAEKIAGHYRMEHPFNFYTANDEDNDANTFFAKIGIHEHVRPRWWWIYLADCNETATFGDMTFDLHWEQNTSDDWSREFGMNDKDLNTVYLVYLVIYIGLVCAQVYAYYLYRIQQYIHQVIKLLTATIVLQMFAVLFHFVDWMIFMETGQHELFFAIIATLCEIMASTVFLLLLFVLAQGWTISRFEVMYPRILLIGVVLTAVAQCVFYVWRLIGLDPQTTVYFYNSVPIICYGAFMIAVGGVFEAFCIWSFRRESFDAKRYLYAAIGSFFSIWFLWFLARIFVGDVFNDWSRDIAITAISETITTCVYFVMMLLLWPTWAHQYFNLSMADTQAKILSAGDDTVTAVNSGTRDYQVLDHERL
jgi:hypothetical protein